jgi:hypothetical protein
MILTLTRLSRNVPRPPLQLRRVDSPGGVGAVVGVESSRYEAEVKAELHDAKRKKKGGRRQSPGGKKGA